MNRWIIFGLGFGLTLANRTAITQTFDADGNRIDTALPRPAPDAALRAIQKQNAGITNNLAQQTPEYWEGHVAAMEYRRERETYQQKQRERFGDQDSDGGNPACSVAASLR